MASRQEARSVAGLVEFKVADFRIPEYRTRDDHCPHWAPCSIDRQ